MTKAYPLICSGESVRAMLADRQTQTRRIINPQPVRLPDSVDQVSAWLWPPGSSPGDDGCKWPIGAKDASRVMAEHCPRPKLGDQFYISEAIKVVGYFDPDMIRIRYYADCTDAQVVAPLRCEYPEFGRWRGRILPVEWARPDRFEVTAVRADRLQNITEADAKAEGVEPDIVDDRLSPSYLNAFINLWAKLWGVNPWVWVQEFKRVKP